MPKLSTATAALLTPRGRGAVATICFAGDCRQLDAKPPLFRAANGKLLQDQPIGRICFGHWGRDVTEEDVTEEVVVCRVDEQTTEIHCHGGDAAARRILDDLQTVGCTIQTWQQMTAAKQGHFAAESLEALSRATTERTARILLEQQSGLLQSAFEELCNLSDTQVRTKIDELLRWAEFGTHLADPWKVVLAGRPNVGKSSLINALVGYSRSIVFDQPGTTRDVVTAETAIDGWPIQFADTAGLRDDAEQLESAGIELARKQLESADCRIILVDTSHPPHEDDWRLLSDWPNAIVVAHKCDLPNAWGEDVPAQSLRVSSVTGAGVEELLRRISRQLVPEVPTAGTAIPITRRQTELLITARTAVESGNVSQLRESIADLNTL